VLIVDDDPPLCDLLRLSLAAKGFSATSRTSAEAALSTLDAQHFDAVVTDLRLPRMDGLELCERITSDRPELPVVVMTGFGNLDAAVAALRAGAWDFITKPIEVDQVGRALQRATLRRPLVERAGSPGDAPDILGESAVMKRTKELVRRAAASDASVLITGESGTGKELVARALHCASQRAGGPFAAINCAAVPEALLESELFGHVRGAFTDAKTSRQGLLLEADGGTVFLDELCDMSPRLQPKLLRALQERCVRPLGAPAEVSFDARIVAATNEDVAAAVASRRLRSDLYFRVNVIPIHLPPLRERDDDVVLLARHFAALYAGRHGRPARRLAEETIASLRSYPWPGNVRELQNSIEHAIALGDGGEIALADLPETVRGSRLGGRARKREVACGMRGTPALGEARLLSLAEVERRHIFAVLETVGGNKRLAARVLGVDRRTLYRKLETYADPGGSDGYSAADEA
jgi:DNA-binding NtrC family response regulator